MQAAEYERREADILLEIRKLFGAILTIVTKLLLITSVFSLLSGCIEDKPSDEEVRRLLIGDGWAEEYLILSNFERTNGYKQGDNIYVVEVSYDLEFLVDQKVFQEIYTKKLITELRKEGMPEYLVRLTVMGEVLSMAFSPLLGEQAKAGDVVSYHESYKFIKSENGWVEYVE